MEIIIRKATTKKKVRHGTRYRGPRYWILAAGTAGAIVAFTFSKSHAMATGYARLENGRLCISRNDDGEFDKLEFRIPAGRLEDVIKQFEKITGVSITVDDPSLLNIQSPGVIGRFTADQALALILENTGISFNRIDAKNLKLVLKAQAAVVEIHDSNADVISSPKYTAPMRDIPQTITVIPKDAIEQQGATTLRDVLNNVPGITIAAGEGGGGPAGDNLTIRGFSARNDVYVDGVRDLGPQTRDPFNLEQIEVVKGPSSVFTGRGSTGGTVNLVSKLPNLRRSVSGALTAGTANTRRATIDINQPLRDSIGFRLNAMGNDADFAGRDDVSSRRWGFAPSVYFGMGRQTRFTASYFFLGQNNLSDYGIPWVPATNNPLIAYRNKPAPVPRDTYYGFVNRDSEKLRSDLVTLRFERDVNDGFTIRNQFRYGYSRRDAIASAPRLKNNNSTAISRELKSWITNDDVWDNQTDLTWRFNTGSIKHAAVFGTSLSWEKNARVIRTGRDFETTLLNPNPNDIYPFAVTVSPMKGDLTARSLAGYFFDTINLNEQWQLVGGLRWDYFGVEGINAVSSGTPPNVVVTPAPLSRIDRIWSGRAAIVYKPVEFGSLYVSYGTSANPSLEGLSYSPADQRTPPESTKTIEAGTKWEFFQSRLLLTGAVFRVEKDNARTPAAVAGEPPTLDGDQRIQGIEFSAAGNVTRDWQITSAYTLLDSEILRSNTPPTNVNGVPISEVGKYLINTPKNSFNLWSTYRWKKLLVGGGPRFVGKRYGNNINTRFVDSYWIVDAFGSYQMTKNFELKLNMYNIADKFYFDRIGGGHIVPGAGRLVTVSTAFNF